MGSMMGCASTPHPVPAAPWLLNVPFFSDHRDQCGPATLAAVLQFWGRHDTPQSLKADLYTPRLKGTLMMDVLLAAQAAGMKTSLYTGSLDDLRTELKAGHPLIAFLNLGFAVVPVGHYVVIVGFDEARQMVCLHSGKQAEEWLPYKKFFRVWSKTDNATLLILPPERAKESAHVFS